MKYSTKAIIIGRKQRADKKDDIFRACFISLFDKNDPHKENIVPKEMIEFAKAKRIDLTGFNVKFMLMGGDLVVNDLKWIDVTEKDGNIIVKGKQE